MLQPRPSTRTVRSAAAASVAASEMPVGEEAAYGPQPYAKETVEPLPASSSCIALSTLET